MQKKSKLDKDISYLSLLFLFFIRRKELVWLVK